MRPDVITIKLRNREVDVAFIDDGYEPEVNYHSIEWWFVSGQSLGFDEADIEEDEERSIHRAILRAA